MTASRRPARHQILLALILALGAAVRVRGLGWGLPHTLAHPDETKFVSIALGMGYGDLNPHWFGYPTLFFYHSAAAFGALYAAGRLTASGYFEREYPDAGAEDDLALAGRRLARVEGEGGIGTLLDVGCGRGLFLAAALARGWKAAGLDVSPAALRLARAASGAPVFGGGLPGPLPAGVEPVDVLTMWDVLEHLTDPVVAPAAVRRWLKPGGLLVVQTENANSIIAAWMGRRWAQFVEFHLYPFSPSTLRAALERAGFEKIRIEDVARFARPAAPDGVRVSADPSAAALGRALRRVRDRLYTVAGHDAFTSMVAAARRPGGA